MKTKGRAAMKPYFPGNRLREISLSRNIVAKLSAKELLRMYDVRSSYVH